MTPIAHIETPFREKFGVPRQAGLVDYEARVVFEPAYRIPEAVRGLEEFDYLWLLWCFHMNRHRDIETQRLEDSKQLDWSPTVRPPRLGGNTRVGVFATRSPYRPNPIGLSCVRLLRIEPGPVLVVAGADLVDGTPILDIKPYLAYADAHPEARSGFAQTPPQTVLAVVDPHGRLRPLPEAEREALKTCLALDPRPHYQHDADRIYTMPFAKWEVRFRVADCTVEVVEVRGIEN